MHGSNGDTDTKNRLVDAERGVGRKERVGYTERVHYHMENR